MWGRKLILVKNRELMLQTCKNRDTGSPIIIDLDVHNLWD